MFLIGVIFLTSWLLYRWWIEGPSYTKTNRIDGKVVIVTGCNMGIGKEIALEMARRGGRVYMACMDYNDCEAARLEIVKRSNNSNVFNRLLDLSSFESISDFVKKFNQEEQHLDILINNAGILTSNPVKTKEGYEPHLAINHLGHFLLTNLLLDRLKAAPSSRIVVVASSGYKLGKINKDDLNNKRAPFAISGYFNSKLAIVLFTRHLAKILNGTKVTVNCLHPGCVNTNIAGFTGIARMCLGYLGKFLVRSPRGGAQTSVYLALDPEMEGKSGGYYDAMKLEKYSGNAMDDELATWLWNKSEIMVGLKWRRDEVKQALND